MSLNTAQVLKIINHKLNHEDFHLENYTCAPLKVDGMMGEHHQLLCNIRRANSCEIEEHKFFVKMKPPHAEDLSKELCNSVFDKEKATFRMFETINLPTLNSAVPRCFYSDDQHLVLENLQAEGYKELTTGRVATEEELYAVLKALAGMHAAGIAYEEQETKKNPNQEKIRLDTKFPEAFIELYMIRGDTVDKYHNALIKGLATAIHSFNLPEVLKSGKLLKDEILRFWDLLDAEIGIKSSKKYRNVMCHADLWPANLFIKYDENRKPQHAKIIDFQIEKYLPPSFDVLDYILLNTTRDYRQKNLLKLKQVYYDFFCQYLEEYGINPLEIYTFDEFLESFKEIELFAIYLELNTIPMVYNCDQTANDVVNSEHRNSILMEDRSPLFTNFKSNTYFMERVNDCMLDMVEYFENN